MTMSLMCQFTQLIGIGSDGEVYDKFYISPAKNTPAGARMINTQHSILAT